MMILKPLGSAQDLLVAELIVNTNDELLEHIESDQRNSISRRNKI